jgi:hypothetical protein
LRLNPQESFSARSSRRSLLLPCTLVEYAGKPIHLGRKQTVAVFFVTINILIITFEAGQFYWTIKSQSTDTVSRFDRFCMATIL